MRARAATTVLLATVLLAGLLAACGDDGTRSAAPPPPVARGGVDDPRCVPARGTPDPVLVVAGTFATRATVRPLARRLARKGACAWTVALAARGAADPARSQAVVGAFAREVLRRTGAGRLALVGHSQGASVAHAVALRELPRGAVTDVVGLAPYRQAVRLPLLGVLATHRRFLRDLRRAGAPPPTAWTNLVTRDDELLRPASGYLPAAPNVANLALQDGCPTARPGHAGLVDHPAAAAVALDALRRPGPARVVRCA